MTSRFTQTEKWDDAWFRQLSPKAKVIYWYIWDKCNIAGYWELDWEGMAFHTKVSKRSLQGAFKELARGFIIKNNHVWVRRFLYHQKNLPLNPENPAHKGILRLINEYKSIFPNILEELEKQKNKSPFKGATKGLASPIGIGKGISKGISKGKGKEEHQIDDFDRFWSVYPKKIGKGQARKSFKKINPSAELQKKIIAAVELQKKSEQWLKEEGQYIPNPATWLNQERWDDELKHKETTTEQVLRLKAEGELS